MAIQCKYCGVALPKDDARFCHKCGMPVHSHPLSPQSLSAAKNGSKISEPSSARDQQERQTRVLHEQIAELSPSRSTSGYSELDEPVRKPGVYEQKPVVFEKLQSDQSPQASVAVEELPLEKLPDTPQPELEEDTSSPIDEIPSSSASSNNEVASAHASHEDARKDEEASEQADEEGSTIEDVPTQLVGVPVEDAPAQAIATTSIEDVPTRAISVPVKNQSRAQEQVVERSSVILVPSTQETTQEQFVEDGRAVRRPRRRWPVVLVGLLLIVLVAGGLGVATLLSQPSSNNAVIQSQVSFRNAQLGVALLYPNGWIKQVDTGNSTVHFYASNHVGEVDIMVASNGGNVKQVLQQQATKMGMSGKKVGATLNFAGENWQQLQGTLRVSGASYTDAILATAHGNQLFMMLQQAPQNNYADWEKEFFAPLRASFKFL